VSAGDPGALRRWYRRQEFHPGALGWAVNPFYFARRGLRSALAQVLPRLSGELLDVGCGRKPYAGLVRVRRYVGLEIDSPHARAHTHADAFYDGRTFPFPDDSFDSAICSQVFEHVFTPDAFLAEIARVVKPGGQLVVTVPFVWDEHEQPHDYARYSSFGLKAALEAAGFEVVEHIKSTGDSRVLFQLLNAYVYKLTWRHGRAWRWVPMFLLMAPVNLLGIVAGAILPRNPDLYLDNIVLARKRGKPA
jgi:SAM-dependent methyltransferase